jgi:hypothetical protein
MLNLYVVINACVATACATFNLPVDHAEKGLLGNEAFELQCTMASWQTAQQWLAANHPEMTVKDWRCQYMDPNIIEAQL